MCFDAGLQTGVCKSPKSLTKFFNKATNSRIVFPARSPAKDVSF